jgi:predicted DsbA family dithiol-disulfide isomerase
MRHRFGAEVTWLPFDLHPEYPLEGLPRRQLLDRYGPGMTDHVGGMFERVGLTYNPNPEVVPNTRLALRVTELARDQGLHDAVHDRLMDAYWDEARDIGAAETLRELAAEAGVTDVAAVLEGDAYADRVLASTAQAQQLGIHAIPAFVLDSKLLILGAQPQAVFEQAFVQLDEQD